ncbi:MAG: ATP-binding protein, partial [Candidatus Aenigmarchaeota archaeon]|nr:ATP-binding protein [Candidatus Aenigmarchaeota archaeon]MCK5452616.1 ATP-binding protein [Candidatus Aenigmarchaeota archaeon]
MHEILIGRDLSDQKKYGMKGTGYVAKHIVGQKNEAHVTTPVKIDLARPHIIGLFGKRGQGKSYSMGNIVEEMMLLPEDIKKNIGVIVIDTMGIYWSMKTPNEKDAELLTEWGLKPRGFDVKVTIPKGLTKIYNDDAIPFDDTFSMKPSSLGTDDWALSFNLELDSEMGILLQKVMRQMRDKGTYTIDEIIENIKKEEGSNVAKDGLINRYLVAQEWGIFSDEGSSIHDIIKPGQATILDVSHFSQASGGWSVKSLVVGLLARHILDARIKARRMEESESMEGTSKGGHMPITWMLIDEAHQFLPREGMTAASLPLLQWVKIGREPGVSLLLATQMPNKLHQEAISQC